MHVLGTPCTHAKFHVGGSCSFWQSIVACWKWKMQQSNTGLLCRGHDVFNALDIFENKTILQELKFGVGDGSLRYYLYNWRSSAKLDSADVGLILL